jgi:hypothetical protein
MPYFFVIERGRDVNIHSRSAPHRYIRTFITSNREVVGSGSGGNVWQWRDCCCCMSMGADDELTSTVHMSHHHTKGSNTTLNTDIQNLEETTARGRPDVCRLTLNHCLTPLLTTTPSLL